MSRLIKKIGQYYSQLGVCEATKFLVALFFSKLPGWHPLFALHLPGIKHPVQLRFGTSDVWVVKEVLLDGEYDFLPKVLPKVIVDAGANIGLAAVFFANKFPDAVVYALEPEESNFKLLETNTAAYPQIKPLKTALWNETKKINLVDPSGGHWGFVTTDDVSLTQEHLGLVEAIRLDNLMEKLNLKRIDILKIDIEGAEKEVFEDSAKWIEKVQIIMVELHERYRPGCDKAFAEATQAFHPKVVKGQIIMCLHPALAI